MRYVLMNQQTHEVVAAIQGASFFVKGKGEVVKRFMSAEEDVLYRAITSVINANGPVLPPGILYEIPLHLVEEWCYDHAKLGALVGYTYLLGSCPEGALTLHTVWAK